MEEMRQSKSLLNNRKELLEASQTARCSVLRTPLASIDHNSAQMSDHGVSNRKRTPQSYTGKVKPDILHLLHDKTTFQEVAKTATQQTSLPSDAASDKGKHILDHVKTKYSVEERKELLAFCKSCEADLHLLLENAGEQTLTAPSYYLDDGSISKYGAMLLLATKLVSQLQKVDHGDAKIGGKKKQNPQAQSKRDVIARDKAKAQQPSQSRIEEESVHEIFSRLGTVTKDWTVEKGLVIGDVVDQNKEDICWAIVLVRMMQAIYNTNLSEDLQLEFSIKELVDQIKPGKDKDLKLSNLNLAFNHIALTGVMKKPTTKHGSEKAGAEGTRIKKPFKLLKDVNASFVEEKVDLYPVGLSLEKTPHLETLPKEEIYILPRKKRITPENMHMVLIVGHGFTDDGQLYFIIQNSWGEE